MNIEKEKPLPWRAFIGVALTMLSLAVVFGLDLVISRESSGAYSYRSQLLPNVAALIMLIVGIVLVYTGFRKTERNRAVQARVILRTTVKFLSLFSKNSFQKKEVGNFE